MRTLNQTSRNDISLTSDGDLALSDGRKAYGYILADAVRTVRGEVQLDTSKGIPYQTTVWENRKRLGLWKHYVHELISGYDFVVSITSFDASIDGDGILNYDMTVETKEGAVTLSSASAGDAHPPAPIPTATESSFLVWAYEEELWFTVIFRLLPGHTLHIDWGDGQSSSVSSGAMAEHEYASVGEYVVRLSDDISHFHFDLESHSDMVRKALSWGYSITDAAYTYYECSLRGAIPTWGPNITDATYCYAYSSELTGPIPEWGTSIILARSCFYKCTGLTGTIPAWGAAIDNASFTYYGCTGLTGAWTDDPAKLMPSSIFGAYCVHGASEALRSLFYTDWGGTRTKDTSAP